jgi:polysaccharide deacetylase
MAIDRRWFIGGAGVLTAGVLIRRGLGPGGGDIPAVSLTFDEWNTTIPNAQPILDSYGLKGTYFVTPSLVNQPSGPSTSQLAAWHSAGHELGVYSGVNMVDLYATDPNSALTKLQTLKSQMAGLGFPVTSLAAAQRAWNRSCRDLAAGIFSQVRVAHEMIWQSLPVPDRLYLREGGTASLSVTDTPTSVRNQVDLLVEQGGAWFVVVHGVATVGDAYNVPIATLDAICERIAFHKSAGRLRNPLIREY